MKFIFKIHSNYDGFTPKKIPERIKKGRFLVLNWRKYLDSVEKRAECWVYFHGWHAFENGVYVKGFVSKIDRDGGIVTLKVRKYSTDAPLTDKTESARIANLVSVKYRQVFLWPAEWDTLPECDQKTCRRRSCRTCSTWKSMPTIDPDHFRVPRRARGHDSIAFVPAYWAIPSRSYVFKDGVELASHVRTSTHIFENFKLGEKEYAYPLAMGIYKALKKRRLLGFDAIIPIPLSPEKAARREMHRTLVLSNELGRLLGAPVRECLKLNSPISKRRMRSNGHSRRQFERRYYGALRVRSDVRHLGKVLLVDDAMTHGSTISQAIERLQGVNEELHIVVTTAVQMIVKEAVKDEAGFSA